MTVTVESEASGSGIALHIYNDIEQGTDEWYALRCGLVTASVVGTLVTSKTLKPADNETSRALTNLLVAERITGHVEPVHESSDMIRGSLDEPYARDIYAEHYAPVTQVGFMVRDDFGFGIGYSPDGLVGDDGLIEIKSRKQKIQLKTILEDQVPAENMAQIQTGLLVSGRKWCDYISYSGGMHLYTKRVFPDMNWHAAIIHSVAQFEKAADEIITRYTEKTLTLPPTTRVDHFADIEF